MFVLKKAFSLCNKTILSHVDSDTDLFMLSFSFVNCVDCGLGVGQKICDASVIFHVALPNYPSRTKRSARGELSVFMFTIEIRLTTSTSHKT